MVHSKVDGIFLAKMEKILQLYALEYNLISLLYASMNVPAFLLAIELNP